MPPKFDRQQCQLAFIAVTALHTPGSANHVTDALSQPPSLLPAQPVAAESVTPSPSFSALQLAQQQAQCPGTLLFCQSSSLHPASHPIQGQFLHGNNSIGVFCPFILASLHLPLFHHLHDLGHPALGLPATLFQPATSGPMSPGTSLPGAYLVSLARLPRLTATSGGHRC